MADETITPGALDKFLNWGTVLGGFLAAFIAGLVRKTKKAEVYDIHVRLEEAEGKIAEQERRMTNATTALRRIESQVIAQERRSDATDIQQHEEHRRLLEMLSSVKDEIEQVLQTLAYKPKNGNDPRMI